GSPLSKLSVQYSEWAQQQREFFAAEAFEMQRRYWASQLSGPIPPLRLPTDRQKYDQANRTAASFPFVLSKELCRSLTLLSQRESATLFMILLAGFAALLNRSTHQEDLLLCTPVTGRHRFHSKELIGYFNNILLMRLDLSGDPSLLELVRRTRRVAIDAYNNQDVPFQWIAELPSLRQFTLSRLSFSLDMEWPPRLEMAGVTCEPMAIETGAADFDLSISLSSRKEHIFGNFRFKQHIFDESIITQMSERYREMLSILAKQPHRKLSSLPYLGPAREHEPLSAHVTDGKGQSPTRASWPNSALEQRLVQEWEDELEQRPIGIHDHLQSLGVSSLAVAALAVRIQTVFKTEVSITEIFQSGTIERMAALLQSRDNLLISSPLAAIQPNGTKPPLFLCEGVGIYYPLVPYLGDDQPVYGLVTEFGADYPRVEDLASHYLRFVKETQVQGPYYLGGVSFGGLVAFEMAQQLHAMGEKVALIALMDTPGPGAYRLKTPARRLLGHTSNLLRYGYPYLHAGIEKQVRKLVRKLSNREIAKENPTSSLIADADQLRSLFKQKSASYEVKPYAGRVTLFMLAQRDGMSDSLFDPALGFISPSLGWESVAADGVERYGLLGGHVDILKEPFVRALGERLRQCLDREQLASAGCTVFRH
ncbi:MAG: condensation domain-containing protein, partial [Alphaproteobacteria bacterium]|nr:condensation domain-containing protein [Alphaproteobacteria bacterium]